MRVSPSSCWSFSSRPTMRAASARSTAASSTPDVHRSGSALAPDAAPARAPVTAANVSALPGTEAAVVMARTGSPAKALTTARAAATVDSACWSSDTVASIASRSSVDLVTSTPRISDAIASATTVAAWAACVDACVTAASSAAITGRRAGSFAKTRPAATARQSAPSPNDPAPASNHGRPARRCSTVATIALPGTRRLRARATMRSLTTGGAPTPLVRSASVEMTSCCTPARTLPFEPSRLLPFSQSVDTNSAAPR